MALLAKMERRVTKDKPSALHLHYIGVDEGVLRTYIVVAVLNEKRDSFTRDACLVFAGLFEQPFLCQSDIAEEGSVGKRASRKRVYYRCTVRFVLRQGLKQGGSL